MANRFSDLIIQLSGGINQRRLYFDSHPKVKALGEEFANRLNEMFERTNETGFFFGVLNGKFIREGKFLVGPSIAGRNLIDCAEKLHCGGFRVLQHVEPDEVTSFFRVAADLREPTASIEESMEMLRAEGIERIELTPYFREAAAGADHDQLDSEHFDPGLVQFDFSEGDDDGGFGKSVALDLAPLLPIFQSMYETVANNQFDVTRDRELDLSPSLSVSEELHGVAADQHTLDIMNLMRYPDYDSYTIGHSVRVSTLALTVGREMGWPEHMLTELATSGLLHDLGKAKVPEDILYKPGKLDPEERKIAESHAAIGANLLLAKRDASPMVVAGAWGHHIREDGGGYPNMPDWAIKSPVAGLIQICDVFEALTAARPYKNPMPPRRAFEIILKDRKAFNPLALKSLINAIGLYPPGSEVVLSDGSRGFVIGRGPDWEQPVVRVVRDKDGHKLDPDDMNVIKLHEAEGLEISDFLSVSVGPSTDSEGEAPTNEELVQGLEDALDTAQM